MTNIYELAKAQMKPEDIDHHESDLYLRKNEISDKLVADYDYRTTSTSVFRDNIDHVLWYEVKFAYYN